MSKKLLVIPLFIFVALRFMACSFAPTPIAVLSTVTISITPTATFTATSTVTPTRTPIPPTPAYSGELIYNPEDTTLYNPQGTPVFALSGNDKAAWLALPAADDSMSVDVQDYLNQDCTPMGIYGVEVLRVSETDFTAFDAEGYYMFADSRIYDPQMAETRHLPLLIRLDNEENIESVVILVKSEQEGFFREAYSGYICDPDERKLVGLGSIIRLMKINEFRVSRDGNWNKLFSLRNWHFSALRDLLSGNAMANMEGWVQLIEPTPTPEPTGFTYGVETSFGEMEIEIIGNVMGEQLKFADPEKGPKDFYEQFLKAIAFSPVFREHYGWIYPYQVEDHLAEHNGVFDWFVYPIPDLGATNAFGAPSPVKLSEPQTLDLKNGISILIQERLAQPNPKENGESGDVLFQGIAGRRDGGYGSRMAIDNERLRFWGLLGPPGKIHLRYIMNSIYFHLNLLGLVPSREQFNPSNFTYYDNDKSSHPVSFYWQVSRAVFYGRCYGLEKCRIVDHDVFSQYDYKDGEYIDIYMMLTTE